MVTSILGKIFGTKNEREVKRIQPLIARIHSLEASFQALSDPQLQAKTGEFKLRISKGESLDSILPEAFAALREGSRRVLGMRHYDVQMIGGTFLHRGTIAEMRTGEGKTLVATLPVYLNALEGKGVHVVTVNDYLAKRDAEWMGRLYRWMGLSIGIIVHDLNDRERKESYAADITYGTNNEFGFDYLRDNMKFDLKDYVQRVHNFAIVDECDSILVDEARTPLIISGPAEESTDKYYIVDRIIPHLQREVHFVMEEKSKTASLTDEGNAKAEQLLGVGNLYDPQNLDLLHHVYQSLKAHHLYKRDVDYMIKDDEIVIVDEFTGRLMPGRRWSDGLHQSIEAKEGVKVKNENQTLASITFQNYFRMYKKLAGMTGTADTEAVEFKKIYNLDVSVIPTNRPMVRKDLQDMIYKTEPAKFRAIAKDIQSRHENGQPMLVGTVSIEKSEQLSEFLRKMGVRHNVLNAKHHEREAEIIAQAGRLNSVTIATNMAGRGTDILLGGNAEFMARQAVADESSPEYAEALSKFKAACAKEREQVVNAGGLYIIGTERHESRRIDNQLRGRSGRQGDPGESRFYLSLEDNLMRIFNGERVQKLMTRFNFPEDEPLEAPLVSRTIESSQKRVEGHNFEIRKHLLEYDDVMNKQRSVIYGLRREVLEGQNLDSVIREFLGDQTSTILELFAPEKGKRELWDFNGLKTALLQYFGADLDIHEDERMSISASKLADRVKYVIQEKLESQKKTLGVLFPQLQKMVLLQTIDTRWKEHLHRIDRLKEGIGLRSYAQKDPLVEYKKEAFNLFSEMNQLVQQETLEKLFKVQIVSEPSDEGENAGPSNETIQDAESRIKQMSPRPQKMTMTHETVEAFDPVQDPVTQTPQSGSTEPFRRDEKVGRNDPCPCGSGKKYKKCHGAGA